MTFHHYHELLFFLMFWHALADVPLQGLYLSQAKNPVQNTESWFSYMFCHAMIHAGGVAIVTNSIILGVCELVAHGMIDYSKCCKKISPKTDQMLHILCKVVWAFIAWAVVN